MAEYTIAHDDVHEALVREMPLASHEFIETLTNAVVAKLNTEGWLIEPPVCQYANAPRTVVCDRPTRPGHAWCPEHSN